MPEPRVVTFREALREAMVEEMERDPSIFLMGEEVGHYQGAYKVSEGMLARFGEREVMYALKGEVPAGEHVVPLGLADVKRPGRDVTVVTWAKMLHASLKAAEELARDGIEVEVLDLRTIRPLDGEAIVDSVRRTGRCLVVQEGWPFAGVAAEVITLVVREAFDELDAPPDRLTSVDVPMPYATNLETLVIPSPDRVVAAVRRLLGLEEAPVRPAAAGGTR